MKTNPDTQEEKGSKESLSIPGLNILGTEGPLPCSSTDSGVQNKLYSQVSTELKPMSLELESTVSLTDSETPSISVQEVCCIQYSSSFTPFVVVVVAVHT